MLWVSRIESDHGTKEEPVPGQIISRYGHAGTYWTIWTSEMGYGANPVATLNSIPMDKSDTKPIHDISGKVVGFTYKWIYKGPFMSGGRLTFHDDSVQVPCRGTGRPKMEIAFQILPWEGAS